MRGRRRRSGRRRGPLRAEAEAAGTGQLEENRIGVLGVGSGGAPRLPSPVRSRGEVLLTEESLALAGAALGSAARLRPPGRFAGPLPLPAGRLCSASAKTGVR